MARPSPGEGRVCWQLYRIIHSDMWRAVGVQVHAVACAFPTPQRRRPDHPCCACGDHKTLTRMCVKRNMVQHFYLVWGASSLFLYFDFFCGSSTLCVLLLCYPCSVHSLKSQANGEFFPLQRLGNSGLLRLWAWREELPITFGTSLCMYCSWISAAAMSKLVCVTSQLQ